MNTIINALLEITVFSAVLYGAILLFQRVFRKHISAALNYAVWALLILRLVIPATFDSGLHLFIIPDESKQAVYETVSNDNAPPQSYPLTYQPTSEDPSFEAPISTETDNTPLNSQDRVKPWNLSWQTVLVIIWGAGVFFSFAFVAILCRRLRQKIKRCGAAAPGYVLRLVNKCKSDMGIGTEIKVSVQGWLRSPALSASFKPMLLIPKHMLQTMDLSQLEFGIRHELAHYRRRDHLTNLLLAALRCVYWFNPVIYLAFRSMQTDMETACDARITSRLKNTERTRYIRTMIDLGGSGNMQYVLGMGMSKGGKEMEKRVRGIFMKKRTRLPVRMAAALLAGLMLIVCFTTACRPTAEGAFTQSGNNDIVEIAVEGSAPGNSQAVMHTFSAPLTWQSETVGQDKKIDIKVDASVGVATDTWGIYQLMPETPDKDYLHTVLKALIGDAQIYGEDTYRSKAGLQEEITEIQNEITWFKKQPQNREQYENPAPTPAQTGTPGAGPSSSPMPNLTFIDVTYYENQLALAQQALANAPDKPETRRVDIDPDILFEDPANIPASSLNPEAFESGQQSVCVYPDTGLIEIYGLADLGEGKTAQIFLSGNKSGSVDIRFQIDCGGNGGFSGRKPLDGKLLKGTTVSQAEAADTAKQRVAEMGFGYLDIASADKMGVYNSTKREETECYAFTFTRSLDGVPATYAYGDGTVETGQYAPRWNVDEIVICVDDSGVIHADINVPKSDVKQLATGVELKGFDEIMDIFNQQAVNEGCYSPYGQPSQIAGRTINIDEIKLGYMPIVSKDHPDQIIFVPVWDFFGSEVTQFSEKIGGGLGEALDENNQFRYDFGNQAFLTINALDGTVMQRS